MIKIFSYLLSKHKRIYKEIAKKTETRSLQVYLLAHGKAAKSDKEFRAMRFLVNEGLVSGWHVHLRK